MVKRLAVHGALFMVVLSDSASRRIWERKGMKRKKRRESAHLHLVLLAAAACSSGKQLDSATGFKGKRVGQKEEAKKTRSR